MQPKSLPINLEPIGVHGVRDGVCMCSRGKECPHPGKHPVGNAWQTQPRKPRAWDNHGYVLGRDAGVWVLDVDKPDALIKLIEEHGRLPKTMVVRTGSGGRHIYFRYPPDGEPIRNRVRFRPGLDVRSDNGFVVAPPSKHVSGGEYVWEYAETLADAPAWLLDMVRTKDRKSEYDHDESVDVVNIDPVKRLQRAIQYAIRIEPAVEGQGGDQQTLRMGSVGYAFGVDLDKWYEWVRVNWNPSCKPPWDTNDLYQKVENAYTYNDRAFGWQLSRTKDDAPADPDAEYRPQLSLVSEKDFDLAHAWLDLYGDEYRIVGGVWYRWHNGAWLTIRREPGAIVGTHLHGSYVAGERKPLCLGDAQATATARAVGKIVDDHDVEGFLSQFKFGVACESGTVLIDEQPTLIEPDRDRPVSHWVSTPWDPTAECPEWIQFLCDVWKGTEDRDDRIAFLAEFVGAALCARATYYDRALLIKGQGGNGKSTLLEALTQLLFPGDASSHVKPHNFGNPEQIAMLIGSRWNCIDDIKESRLSDTAAFKELVSGAPVAGRKLYYGPIKFRPQAAHVFSMNDVPTTFDNSDGFWRRITILDFPNKFSGKRTRADFVEMFRKELPGIFRWAVDGACRLYTCGAYTELDRSLVNQQRIQSDEVLRFVHNCVEVADVQTSTNDIWDAFLTWYGIDTGGRLPWIRRRGFFMRFSEIGFDRWRNRTARGYKLRLRPRNEWRV